MGALKRLSPEECDFEDSQQTIDQTGKNVGNCKPARALAGRDAEGGSSRWASAEDRDQHAAAILLGACATPAETPGYGAYGHYPEYAMGWRWR